jgi:mannose-6-phosphate isomerase-like protein (cupin superfamily)
VPETDRLDFVAQARQSDAFRREIITGPHSQIVVMAVQPGDDIGEEVHEDNDQILMFVEGEGEAVLDGERSPVGPDDLVFVKAGTKHNFINTGNVPLRLVTVYAPPEHSPGTVHATKADATEAESH